MVEESNLVSHARRELELIPEDPDTIEGMLKVVQAFSDMGHSGASAAFCIPMLSDLLQFKNLTPLTDNPAEWRQVDGNMWQNKRNSEAFSHDAGEHYYLLSEGRDEKSVRPLHKSATYNDVVTPED